jgi:putative endonuclease
MPLFNSMRLRLFEGLLTSADRLSARMGRSARLADHLELGLRGEEAAFFYLRRLGFTVVARRWHSHRYAGDLDLVAWENDTLCFIEVKTRSSREIAAAEAAVDDHKQKTLRRIARHYMRQSEPALITRFDVLSIYFEKEAVPEFHLFRGAFDWS